MFEEELNLKKFRLNYIVILINILVFFLTDILGTQINGTYLVDAGALSWDRVLNHHEYYRVFTSMFLHSDIDHIFNNMLILLFIDSYVEDALGGFTYLSSYLLSGILAGCTSMVYNMIQCDYTVSIGASGAIFGIMGVLVCAVFLRRKQGFDLRKVIFMAFLSLYAGFANQGVDNAAHIGGFIAGILITFIFEKGRTVNDQS